MSVFGVGETVAIDGGTEDTGQTHEAEQKLEVPIEAVNDAADDAEDGSTQKLRQELLSLQSELEALGKGLEGKPRRQDIRKRGKELQELLARTGKDGSTDDDKTPPLSKLPALVPPGYNLPSWSAKPAIPFVLEVLKNGVSVEKVDISGKEFFSFGRQEGTVDVLLAHPSISRQHAVVQHADNGMFIYDLGSANGTFVNKQRIPKEAYQKLTVGHVIKFGESSRLYVVDGPHGLMPDEYDSARLQKLRDKLKKRTEKAEKQKDMEKEASYASWGFDEDAQEEEEEEEDKEDEREGVPGDEDEGGGPAMRSAELPEYIRLKNQKDAKKGLEGQGLGSSLDKKEVDDKVSRAYSGPLICRTSLLVPLSSLPVSLSQLPTPNTPTHVHAPSMTPG
jgi:pSer/pThr/pTyr-binding forkhead associated (FHA) protein